MFVLFSELRPTLLHSVLISYIIVTLYILVSTCIYVTLCKLLGLPKVSIHYGIVRYLALTCTNVCSTIRRQKVTILWRHLCRCSFLSILVISKCLWTWLCLPGSPSFLVHMCTLKRLWASAPKAPPLATPLNRRQLRNSQRLSRWSVGVVIVQ